MHEKQLRFDRRKLIGSALGAIASTLLAKESAIAPDASVNALIEQPIDQSEIDELEANLYDTARRYDLSLVPEDAIREAFVDLKIVSTDNEAISIISEFTQKHFGFHVNNKSFVGNTLKKDARHERFLSVLSLLPRELYETIELEKVDIGRPPIEVPKGSMALGSFTTYSLYGDEGNAITLAPGDMDSAEIILHEVSHGLDYVSRLDGSDEARHAADVYLNEGIESEYVAKLSAAWMMGDDRQVYQAGTKVALLLERYDRLVPGMVPYIENALQPYMQTFPRSKKDYFFQPESLSVSETVEHH